jgi:hypothetical protein
VSGPFIRDDAEQWYSVRLSRRGVAGRFMPQSGMNDENATYPYTLTISPSERLAGHFDWAIRRYGKLIERSDRLHPSERSARESGQEALERQLRDDREPKRGFQSGRQSRTG